ncbi:cytochrome P450 [Coniella lustricola]|uniref:Cytochrome P450 n=1 Tax=Coniella lustricola TaxID=2025994 RepID=A0A2T3A6Y3_9PEZI|nr:cytochrome P450 [Coniella lustricola]
MSGNPWWRSANLGALFILLIVVLWHRYVTKRDSFIAHNKRNSAEGTPWTFPYVFPLLRSLPLMYLWNPKSFVLNPNNFFQSTHPTKVKILHEEFYVIRGSENVRALFKSSWMCTSIPFVKFALGYAFGLPSAALNLYDKDDSGGGHVPHPDSTVKARNRVDYRVYQSMLQFLEGKGFSPFWHRFADNIAKQLDALYDSSGSSWDSQADLMELVGNEATIATVNALCGPHLLRLNPNFLHDFWAFDRNLQTYLQGLPQFLAPRAYAARRKVLDAVKKWQQYARKHFDECAVGADGDDPYWGSSFFRERQKLFLEMDGFDHTAIASEDFGAIWAARNSITAASWIVFEIYRDPELLVQLRAELDSCVVRRADSRLRFDIDQILRLPLLQAVYAETLRLRMHFYVIRMADRLDINIRDFIIPKRKTIVALTTVAHMDPEVWSTGTNSQHPVDQFWPGRFLKYPSENKNRDAYAKECCTTTPIFSTKGLEGSWIPYGGGPRQCPGRHFAKRQILLTTAMMVSLFDCEISGEGKSIQEDLSLNGFGSGVSHPAGKVPFRIRRRERL